MNDQPSAYDAVIADLRSKRDDIDQLIQRLELFRNWAPPPSLVGLTPEPTFLGSIGSPPPKAIADGTFHGMSIETATKKLLQIRRRTMGAQDIATDLRAGGLHLQSETPTNTITSVLTRAFNSGSDIVRVSRGMWGLQEWYPNQRFRRGSED